MAVGDRKDENTYNLQEGIIKQNTFPSEQERELTWALKNLGFGNFGLTSRFEQFLGLFYLGEIVSVNIPNGSAGAAITIAHNLKEIPDGYIIVDWPVSASGDVDVNGEMNPPILVKEATTWTSTDVYFWCNHDDGTVTGGDCTFKVWLWKTYSRR